MPKRGKTGGRPSTHSRPAPPPLDAVEERYVRKLPHSVRAPADWIFHAKIVVGSWDGLRTRQIADALSCTPKTVRERLDAFNERRVEGLGMKRGSGRKPRLTELERSTILALVKLPPPGKPTYELTGELETPAPRGESEWTLDALTAMAQARGIRVARSQVRRIFRQEGVRWRRTRLVATSKDPDLVPRVPKRPTVARSNPPHRRR